MGAVGGVRKVLDRIEKGGASLQIIPCCFLDEKASPPRTPMLTFLFWNLNKRRLEDSLASLARQHMPDVIALAESRIDPADAQMWRARRS